MNELKKWLPELLLCTIVAVVATLLSYLVGLEKTWAEASQTFMLAFGVMFLMGVFNRRKNKKTDK